MRKVDRTKINVPASLAGQTSPAAIERQRAAEHFRDTPKEKFDFNVYKKPDIAVALNTLFHGKCAYCESSITAVQPTDIEHFRPKGRVAECAEHLGYWWLAASWDNLLASCIDCNRRRYTHAQQLSYDQLAGELNGTFLLGKGDSFPILGERYALLESDDHDAENAALIDPTRRDPEAHLMWLYEKELSLIGPRVQNGVLDPYGWHTYRVFGLNRQGLVEQRTARLREITSQIVFIEGLIDIALSEQLATKMLSHAVQQLSSLYRYAEPDQPYSAMAKALLDRESKRLMDKYQTLIHSNSASGSALDSIHST